MSDSEPASPAPADLARIATVRQFGRHLAEDVRGRLTQRGLSHAIEKAVRRGEARGVRPLTVQRISGMENLGAVRLPTDEELYSYLYGCGAAERFEPLRAVLVRLRRELLEADRARAAAEGGEPVSADRAAPVPVALAGLPGEEGFSGRDALLAALDAVLTPAVPDPAASEPAAPDPEAAGIPAAPPVTVAVIAGLAGAGKTALAIRAAHRASAAGWFPGGVLFVDLHGYDAGGGVDPGAALAALLGALGVAGERIPGSQGERETLYRSELARLAERGQRVLVVADNASAASQASPLRPGHPSHRMLVTSRDTLPVAGARRIEVHALLSVESVEVVDRALRAANPQDRRVAAEPDAALALATLCGNLPLALRIAAEQLADLPRRPIAELVEVLTEARDRLGELAYGDSVAVRAAFETSYRRLPADQARLFRLLALNPGTHIVSAAAAALANAPRSAVRHLLAGLQRAHLLHPSAVGEGFEFHDLVRLYALEQCLAEESTQDQEEALDRMLEHYRAWCEAASAYLGLPVAAGAADRFADRAAALSWLEAERSNLVAMVALALRSKRDEHAYAIAFSLRFFFNLRKYRDDWIATGEQAVAAARRLGDRAGEGRALGSLAVAYLESRRLEESLDRATEALALARDLNDQVGEAKALINGGNFYYESHRWAEAATWYQQAFGAFQGLGDAYGAAQALNNLGYVHRHQRRLDDAQDYFRRAMTMFEDLGEELPASVGLTNLGNTYEALGRFEDALDCHRRALSRFESLGDPHHEGWALNGLGTSYLGLNRPAEALEQLERALTVRRATEDRHGQGVTLADLGEVYVRLRQPDRALECFQQAAALFAATDDSDEVARVRAAIVRLAEAPDRTGPDGIEP